MLGRGSSQCVEGTGCVAQPRVDHRDLIIVGGLPGRQLFQLSNDFSALLVPARPGVGVAQMGQCEGRSSAGCRALEVADRLAWIVLPHSNDSAEDPCSGGIPADSLRSLQW